MVVTPAEPPAAPAGRRRDISLLRWVWRAYIRNALLPLLAVELLLVAAYLASHAWSSRRHVEAMRDVARLELARIARDEASVIELQLGRVANLLDVLRRRAEDALAAPGGSGPEWRRQRLAAIEQLTRDIADVSTSIVDCYVDTGDTVVRQAASRAAVAVAGRPDPRGAGARPAAVFWGETVRDAVDVGPTVTVLAPVYRGAEPDAVIVAVVTIAQLGAGVRDQEIPWLGAAALIGANDEPLVLQPAAEALFDRAELRPIRARVAEHASGWARFAGDEPYLAAWTTIPTTGWKLLTLAPEAAVFGPSRKLADDLVATGWVMLAGLLGFYLFFFTYLYRRARAVSRSIVEPLTQIEQMARRIAVGDYEQASPEFGVSEFRHTVGELRRMGRLLGDSNRAREVAEARLTERNDELSTILSLSPDGLVSFDTAGQVTETNPAFLALTGWSRAGLIGRSRAEFWAAMSRLGAIEEPSGQDAVIMRLQRPRETVLECRVVGAAGEAQVAYFRDITRADELDRLKSRFLATAAHELRTPIAVITGYTEFLEAADPPESERQEILTTMRRHGDQITSIVTELLDLARIEARAGRDFTMIRQPLEPAVRRFVETFRLGDDARVPRLAGTACEAEAFVDGDKFCQALGNVLSNACKYSPAGSPVTVRFVSSDREIGVEVQDEGTGMEPAVVERIFERFYRGESAAAVPGSGLGMSIVKEIMDIHCGRVEVASLPARGTTVTLWLPRADARG